MNKVKVMFGDIVHVSYGCVVTDVEDCLACNSEELNHNKFFEEKIKYVHTSS